MRRVALVFLAALAAVLVGTVVYGAWRNPERTTLDASARADAPGQFMALAHGVTHYDLAGPSAGRLVVLVHGFSVPYYIWDSTTVHLADAGYRVLRYDLYGRGFSDRPRTDYDGALYDAQLDGLLDSLRLTEPVDLVALSFGAFVASHYVAGHAARVRTLTLVDPASERPQVPPSLGLPVIGPWLWNVLYVPRLADGQMTDFLHPERHPTWVDQYRPQMRYKGFGRALLSTMIMTTRVDFDDLYAGVARTGVPVMLVWGRQDQTVRFDLSEVVLRNIPSAEFVPVDSSGHLPHIEQAALVSARLVAFLEAHP